MRKSVGLVVALMLGMVTVGRAAPLDLKEVAGDAKIVAHLDIDALVAASLTQKAKAEAIKKHPESQKHLELFKALWKFDPTKDLHSITVYSKQFKPGSGVAIVKAKIESSLLLEKVKLAPEHRVSTYGKYEVHSWLHAKGSRHERTIAGTFYKPDVLVFGASIENLYAALDVLDGKNPNLYGKDAALGVSVPTGAILVAGALDISSVNLPCHCPLPKQLDALTLAVGESQGEVYVQAQLNVKQAETAQKIKAVLDGAIAFASLAHSDNADAMKVISAVKVGASDKAVTLEARGTVDAVWAMIQKAAAKAEKMHKEGHGPFGAHGPHGGHGPHDGHAHGHVGGQCPVPPKG